MKKKRTTEVLESEVPKWKQPSFDPTLYMVHLEDSEMSDEQKIEFIKEVRNIMEHFVNSAFDGAPTHFEIARKHRESKR